MAHPRYDTDSWERTELVNEMRRQKVTRTYNYVRDSWMSLYDPEHLQELSMSKIYLHFMEPRLGLDLRKGAPEDIHEQIDPDNLLCEYELVVGRNCDPGAGLQQEQPSPPIVEPPKTAARQRARGGAFSSMARRTFNSGLDASKKAVKNGLNGGTPKSESSRPGSEHEAWMERQPSMEASANNWRTRNLGRIPFSHSKFSALRSKHIHQPISEIGSNG